MRFLALFGVLIGDRGMVVHLGLRIKMGREGWIDGAAWPLCSARQPQQHQKRTVQLLGRLSVDAANNPPNAVAAERKQFVCHDLRSKAKTILGCHFDHRAEWKSVLQVRRNGTDEDCRKVSGGFVALNDNTGPRPPEIGRDDHQHDIAACYFHDSQS
jgi:hypothetical protein